MTVISHFTFIHHGTNLAPCDTLCRANKKHYNASVINQSGLSAMNVLHPVDLLRPLYHNSFQTEMVVSISSLIRHHRGRMHQGQAFLAVTCCLLF